MKLTHGVVMVILVLVAYSLGAMYPALYTKVRGMV